MFKNLTMKNKRIFIKTTDEDMKLTMSVEIKSNHVLDVHVLNDIERQVNLITMNGYEKKTQ